MRFIIGVDDIIADTSRSLADRLCVNPEEDAHRQLVSDPEFWQSVQPIPGAQEEVRKIAEIGELVYVTCRPEYSGTQDWLRTHGFPQRKVYHASGTGFNPNSASKDAVISSLEPDFVVADRPKLIPAAIGSSGVHYRVALFQQQWTMKELIRLKMIPDIALESRIFWTALYDGTDKAWKELGAYLQDQSKLIWV